MTISITFNASHLKSFNLDVSAKFRILLVPESRFEPKDFHYIILLDKSLSMKGEKLQMAKEGANELVSSLPQESYFSLLAFDEKVSILKEHSQSHLIDIDEIKAGSGTSLYKALEEASKLAERYRQPSYLILLTDGVPTDRGCTHGLSRKFDLERCLPVYQGLSLPHNVQVISFGIGQDYNEKILSLISEKGNGFFYHIKDPKEIVEKMPKLAKSSVAAKNVTVDIISESAVKLLNYNDVPIKINAVEGIVKILGETVIPKGYQGKFMTIKVSYEDENGSNSKTIEYSLTTAKDQQDFFNGVNKDIIMEYEYLKTLRDYSRDVGELNLVEATKKLEKLRQIAEQTRRTDLLEATEELTRRKSGDPKEIESEVTRKMRDQS
ncbi:MAG: VWA domain-containing protein [Metallosphaera sp.]